MSHPRWPGFPTKTGNPMFDNGSRNANRAMWRSASALRFKNVNGRLTRKRKKQLKRIEGGNYVKIIAAAMNQLAKRGSA